MALERFKKSTRMIIPFLQIFVSKYTLHARKYLRLLFPLNIFFQNDAMPCEPFAIRSEIMLGLWPNKTAPLNTANLAPLGTTTLWSGNSDLMRACRIGLSENPPTIIIVSIL